MKNQNVLPTTLMFISLLAQLSCESSTYDVDRTTQDGDRTDTSGIIDIHSDLSGLDFENYVLNNPNFSIKINDTLALDFNDIVIPEMDDSNADKVYSTLDGKGTFSFDDNQMYFIYEESAGDKTESHEAWHASFHEEGTFSVKGSLYTDPQEAEAVRAREISKLPKGYQSKAKQVLQTPTSRHAVIVLTNNDELKKQSATDQSPLSPKSARWCGVDENATIPLQMKGDWSKAEATSHECSMSQESSKNSYSAKKHLHVYTYKKALPNSDIQWAKLYTIKTMKCSYYATAKKRGGFYYSFSYWVRTYFNKAKNGRKVKDFKHDLTALLYNWGIYAWNNLGARQERFKNCYFLLLTEGSNPSTNDGNIIAGEAYDAGGGLELLGLRFPETHIPSHPTRLGICSVPSIRPYIIDFLGGEQTICILECHAGFYGKKHIILTPITERRCIHT